MELFSGRRQGCTAGSHSPSTQNHEMDPQRSRGCWGRGARRCVPHCGAQHGHAFWWGMFMNCLKRHFAIVIA